MQSINQQRLTHLQEDMALQNIDINYKYALNDGNYIPVFGLGVYQGSSDDVAATTNAVYYALQNGYPMIDTAQMYK